MVIKYRMALLVSIVVIVPVGYVIRFAGAGWLNDFFGSLAYEIFWVLLVAFIFPRVAVWKIAIAVCLATCLLEWLQLWQNSVYLTLKSTFIGRLVLGRTFVWSDFPSYFVGSFAGWGWARLLQRSILLF